MSGRIERSWYSDNDPLTPLLLPFSLLFYSLAAARRVLYQRGLLRSYRVDSPVIVVGNLTVGGSGKTPLVIALYRLLRGNGFVPGVISRGYGGRSPKWPCLVEPDSDPLLVGDEPVMMARRGVLPLVVGPDRVAAARRLLELRPDVDLILSDDGLQHYRLARDLELVVIDGERRFGNGRLLPAGPLREAASRLSEVDLVVVNGPQEGETGYRLVAADAHRVAEPERVVPLADLLSAPLHVVAGIGHPGRFFAMLRRLGGDQLICHRRPDHDRPDPGQYNFSDRIPVLMTEKDAVKYRLYASDNHYYLPVEAELDPPLCQQLLVAASRVRAASGR
jgi:tetraacyldisaccharide 4'-kinase